LKEYFKLGEEMGKLTIYREEATAFTAVSNQFIDEYMREANDAQLKVYLYLLRASQANQPTSVSDMADLFNHTEKDIMRSLKYWEKKLLLSLDYDSSKGLSSIRLLAPGEKALGMVDTIVSSDSPLPKPLSQERPIYNVPEKPSYSADDIKVFCSSEEAQQLLFIVEQYMGRPLSSSEIRTIYFICDKLSFSPDMIDYLVQYCVGKGKKSFRYIEKVAIQWAENSISTPQQAKDFVSQYDKNVYTIMKALGKNSDPTPKEVDYITRWTKQWGFSLCVVEAACERTVLAVDKHRFEYADSILSNWNRRHVHTLEDIRTADASYRKARPATVHSCAANNQFNQFPQREYDFDTLEKELLSN